MANPDEPIAIFEWEMTAIFLGLACFAFLLQGMVFAAIVSIIGSAGSLFAPYSSTLRWVVVCLILLGLVVGFGTTV